MSIHIKRRKQRGLTLIELVVVMVIIGVLASIAIPSYQSYVRRANRTEGRAALLALAAAEEKFYLQCNTYTTDISSDPTDCATGNLQFPTSSERGYYTLAISTADVDGWSATATANGLPQSEDDRCRLFQLTSTGLKTAKTAGDADSSEECWAK